jgi:hypothetical protein
MTATFKRAAEKLVASNWSDDELRLMAEDKRSRVALRHLLTVLQVRTQTIVAQRDDAAAALEILAPFEKRIAAALASVDGRLSA